MAAAYLEFLWPHIWPSPCSGSNSPRSNKLLNELDVPLCQFIIKERRAKEAPVKTSIALQQERGPDSLSLDQIVIPEVLEVICQSLWRTILSPSIDSHQRRVGTIPIPDLLGQRRSTPLNRLGSHQQSIKPTAGLPHLLWSMDEHGRTLGRTLKGRNHRCQHVVVGMLDGGKVVLAAGHWCRVVRRSKASLMGISRLQRFPLNPFRSPNHVATRLILLTQPLLIRPTRPTSSPATRVVFVMSFSGDD
jgi:hypothetical protein